MNWRAGDSGAVLSFTAEARFSLALELSTTYFFRASIGNRCYDVENVKVESEFLTSTLPVRTLLVLDKNRIGKREPRMNRPPTSDDSRGALLSALRILYIFSHTAQPIDSK